MGRFSQVSADVVLQSFKDVLDRAHNAPVKVACIGSRALSQTQLRTCMHFGNLVCANGAYVGSGNADGADQAFQSGAGFPESVVVYLPWPGFNAEALHAGYRVRVPPYPKEYEVAARECHSGFDSLSRGPRALHLRNMAIIGDASFVLAWPGDKPWGGGTGTGIRRALQLGVPMADLSDPAVLKALESLL
jgi:hypothetical protein